jgi:hypothetical protein
MTKEIFQRLVSQIINRRRIPVAIGMIIFSILWFLTDGDTVVRNFLLGMANKVPNIFWVYIFVLYVTHPILIPLTLIFVIILGLLLWDVVDNILTNWNDKIEILPSTRTVQSLDGGKYHCIAIKNTGGIDISECFADLERAVWFQFKDNQIMGGNEVGFSGRLGWVESDLQTKECKRTIERENSGTLVRVVEQKKSGYMILKGCDDSQVCESKTAGEWHLLIRIGGIVDGWSIKPVFAYVTTAQFVDKGEGRIRLDSSTGVLPIKNRQEFENTVNRWKKIYEDQNERNKKGKEANKEDNPS